MAKKETKKSLFFEKLFLAKHPGMKTAADKGMPAFGKKGISPAMQAAAKKKHKKMMSKHGT